MSNSVETSEELLEFAKKSRNVGKMLLWGIPFDIAIIYIIANMQTNFSVLMMSLILFVSMGAMIIPMIIYAYKRAEKYELLAKQAQNK